MQPMHPAHAPGLALLCRTKDASTTQASLGFKICGMQVGAKQV